MNYSVMHSFFMDGRTFLQALLDAKGLNTNSLAVVGKKQSLQPLASRYLRSKTKEPRMTTLQPLADFFGVDVVAFFDAEKARSELDRLGISTPKLAAEDSVAAYRTVAKKLDAWPYPSISLEKLRGLVGGKARLMEAAIRTAAEDIGVDVLRDTENRKAS